MSVLCRYCGNRVASAGSLAGHYRRKHPERVGPRPAIRAEYPASPVAGPRQSSGRRLSDAAYVASLAEMGRIEKPTPQPELSAGASKESSLAWWPWLLLLLAGIIFVLVPDSGEEGGGKSGLLSTYQPERDGQ